MRAQFIDFVCNAYDQGIRTFLQVGDLLDGIYKHSVWEQAQRGFDEQVAEAISVIPQQPGAMWHFIKGNHDETFEEQAGIDIGRAIVQAFKAEGRDDLVYHGARGAYLRLKGPGEARGLLVEMWHPRGSNNSYARSYGLQKHIEKYAPGQKPDVVLAGHWHTQMYFETRGVHAFAVGCWQGGQSSFGKSIGGAPSIGSWIVDYALTEKGTVRCLRSEWRGYAEVETVRDVDLG
jgi:predicted phosphodiesterase